MILRKIYCLSVCAIFFILGSFVHLKSVEHLMIDADKKNISMGSICTIAVKLFVPQGSKVLSWKEKFSDDLVLKDFICYKEKILKNKRSFFRYDYKITAYQVGKYSVDPFVFEILLPDGIKKTLKTEKLQIEVVSILKKSKSSLKLRDNIDFLPPEKISIWQWLGMVLCLLLGGGGIYFLVKVFRSAKSQTKQMLVLVPEDVEALKALEKSTMTHFETSKQFYGAMSSILKKYLERRFVFNAQESTSTELLSQMKTLVSRDIFFSIRDFSTDADLVKFAKKDVPQELISKVIDQIKDIVLKTKKVHDSIEENVSC